MKTSPRVLILDSRDSFVHNVAHAFRALDATVVIEQGGARRADAILDDGFDLVCVGPGPRGPDDLPALLAVVRGLVGAVPYFGICLGMQVLGSALGVAVVRAVEPRHGVVDAIHHGEEGLLRGLPNPLWAMRYHSLILAREPPNFMVTARCAAGQIMAIEDDARRAVAVQFHPESVGTHSRLTLFARALWPQRTGSPASLPGRIPPESDAEGRMTFAPAVARLQSPATAREDL